VDQPPQVAELGVDGRDWVILGQRKAVDIVSYTLGQLESLGAIIRNPSRIEDILQVGSPCEVSIKHLLDDVSRLVVLDLGEVDFFRQNLLFHLHYLIGIIPGVDASEHLVEGDS